MTAAVGEAMQRASEAPSLEAARGRRLRLVPEPSGAHALELEAPDPG